jgi:A118 family predicted phage portal protein
MDISDINITSIFANKLANIVMSDSTVKISEKNARGKTLSLVTMRLEKKLKKIVAAAFGVGGCAIVPYVKNGNLYFDIVKQNRILISNIEGDRITQATILADTITIDNRQYYRFVDYNVSSGTLYMQNRVTNTSGSPAYVEKWSDIPDMAITNVDRVLFGFIKCPVDNRKSTDNYGVPITYGTQETMKSIKKCLSDIKEEFELKRVRLQVDTRVLDKDPKTGKPILKDKLFMKGTSDDGNLFNIFNPDIRESSFHAQLHELCELEERQVGTSKGILTSRETVAATATEIKSATQDTFDIVSAMRKSVESGLADFFYACNVLANYYNLSPIGDYEITYDWSYKLLESSTETWQQKQYLHSQGALSTAEMRAWHTGEDEETAKKKVKEIKKEEPKIGDILAL